MVAEGEEYVYDMVAEVDAEASQRCNGREHQRQAAD
jgi:hypothetical protein